MKLKGIGGGAPQGVKPAVQLESTPEILPGETAEWRSGWRPYQTSWEVVHGRRQLVPWDVLLSQVTSEIPATSCYHYSQE